MGLEVGAGWVNRSFQSGIMSDLNKTSLNNIGGMTNCPGELGNTF